jgi:hypothetical protein
MALFVLFRLFIAVTFAVLERAAKVFLEFLLKYFVQVRVWAG